MDLRLILGPILQNLFCCHTTTEKLQQDCGAYIEKFNYKDFGALF